jgi:hypothetical protein
VQIAYHELMQRRRSTWILAAAIGATGLVGCAARPLPCVPAAASTPPPPTAVAPPPVSKPATPEPPPSLRDVHEQVALQILTALGDHDFDAVTRQFDERMRRDVPTERVSRVWSGAVAANGELLSWKLLAREAQREYEQLRYELKLENGKLEALVTFEEKGTKVAGLFIRPLSEP